MLEAGFRNPPAAAKPRIWWHWVNGHVSREGITADLEAGGLSVKIKFHDFIYAGSGDVTAEVSDNGTAYRQVAVMPLRLWQTGMAYDGLRFTALPSPVSAKHWRFTFKAGVRMKITGLTLLSQARIPDVRAKTLRVRMPGGVKPALPKGAPAVDKGDVIDLTGKFDSGNI